MANNEIKEKAKQSGVRLWQVADKLGITDGMLSRKLRKELPEAEKAKIFDIINDLKEAAANG